MDVTLLRSGHCLGDPGELPLKHASINGRQLFHLASPWPELQTGRSVGIYQAAGQEKNRLADDAGDIIEATGGFDAFRPAAMIFEFLPFGPFAHLAVALTLTGPFTIFSGDDLAGPMALAAALHDLRRGRCQLALVGGYRRQPDESWLLLLGPGSGTGLHHHVQYTHGTAVPTDTDRAALHTALGKPASLVAVDSAAGDPLALAALQTSLQRAGDGEAVAVWRVTADGRGLLLGLGPA